MIHKFEQFIKELSEYGLPIKKINKVYHVGNMNISKKSKFSLEGSGLSVSLNPDEWISIARLGGNKINTLTNPSGKFIDAHKISKKKKNEIINWGVDNGYVEYVETYKVCWYDEEMEEEVCMEFETYDEALDEIMDENEIVVNKKGIIATNKLLSDTMQDKIVPSQTFDLLLTVYVEKNFDLDGIWWNDVLDVQTLSAPRGVIFNSKIKNWNVS